MGRARYNTGLFPLPDNVLPVQLFGGTSTAAKIISAQPAFFTITHPLIPSLEGKPHTQPIHYQQKSNFKISPLERGRGCVTAKSET